MCATCKWVSNCRADERVWLASDVERQLGIVEVIGAQVVDPQSELLTTWRCFGLEGSASFIDL